MIATEDYVQTNPWQSVGIAAGVGVSDFIQVLEQGSAVNIARKIGHVRGHQDRIR